MLNIPTPTQVREVITDKLSKAAFSCLAAYAGIKVSESESESETADIVIHDPSFYKRVLTTGTMGLGNSYMERVWDSPHIDEVIIKILRTGIYQKIAAVYDLERRKEGRTENMQDPTRSREVIDKHYDLPVEFYKIFLDEYNQYTCARDLEKGGDLDKAQWEKMDNICKKIGLKKGDKVMDFGGGWGGLAQFMKEEYEAIPTVVTASAEQAAHIREKYGGEIEVLECDYRDIPDLYRQGNFDAITAVGVWEHIGHKNHGELLDTLHQCLKPGGNILVHSLYTPYSSPKSNPLVHEHVFPNGEITPKEWMEDELSRLFIPDENSEYPTFEELTPNYPPTLHAWKDRLTAAKEDGRIEIIDEEHVGENQVTVSAETGKIQMTISEFRKWEFYFMLYAGAITTRDVRVGQFLYKKAPSSE